jgi:hypothetical protein
MADQTTRLLTKDTFQTYPGESEPNWAYLTGYISALAVTAAGLVYFLVILGALLTGNFTFPPTLPLQLFGGIISLLTPPFLVLVIASLHVITPPHKKVLSLASLSFTLLFAGAVSTNRFTQLGIVRHSQTDGISAGIDWFLAYGDYSVMFGLEMLGWNWFLGLALLCAAPLFSGGKLESWLRWLLAIDGLLCLIAAVAFLLRSPLSLIGFAAWGLVLFIITALLAIYFRRIETGSRYT